VDAVSGDAIKPDADRYHNPTKVDIPLFVLEILRLLRCMDWCALPRRTLAPARPMSG